MTFLAPSFFIAAAVYAALSDHAERRVSNRTNLAILGGGLLAAAFGGAHGALGNAMLGVLIGFAVLFVPFARAWVGGGDIKFLAAAGAWLGPMGIAFTALIGLAAGGLWALIMLARDARLRAEVAGNLRYAAITLSDPQVGRRRKDHVIPLVIPLALSSIAVFLLGVTP